MLAYFVACVHPLHLLQICEYKDTLGVAETARLNARTVWQHILAPQRVDKSVVDQEWNGHIGAVKALTAKQTATLQYDIATLRSDLETKGTGVSLSI